MKTYTLEELKAAQAKGCRIEMQKLDGTWMPLFQHLDLVTSIKHLRIHPADEWKARLPRLREGAEWCCDGDYSAVNKELAKQHEAAQAPDFGEPWKAGASGGINYSGDFDGLIEIISSKRVVARFYAPNDDNNADFDRIIACVNALSGVPDPAEFVRQAMEMREAIGLAHKALIALNHEGGCYCDAQYAMHGAHPRHSEECDMANAAISKLKLFLL